MIGFFRIGNERFVSDQDRILLPTAQGRTPIASLFISQHRVSGLLLDFQKAVGGWRVRGEVEVSGLFLNI